MGLSEGQLAPQAEVQRGVEMRTPGEVAGMLRLKALGWGIKRIARELGCSHMTVRRYVAEGGYARAPPWRRRCRAAGPRPRRDGGRARPEGASARARDGSAPEWPRCTRPSSNPSRRP